MSQIPKSELYIPSFDIATNPEGHGFDRRPEEAFDLGREPALITGAYMTGDPEDPPLRQLGLLREDIAESILMSSTLANAAVELSTAHLPHLPDDDMKLISEQIKEALGDMEEPSEDEGFAIIALQALYEISGQTIPHTLISREFVDILSQKVEVPKFNEEQLRQLHASQAEHNPDIESFEEWAKAIDEALDQAGSDEGANRLLAENSLNFLVVPMPYMHPVARTRLFS